VHTLTLCKCPCNCLYLRWPELHARLTSEVRYLATGYHILSPPILRFPSFSSSSIRLSYTSKPFLYFLALFSNFATLGKLKLDDLAEGNSRCPLLSCMNGHNWHTPGIPHLCAFLGEGYAGLGRAWGLLRAPLSSAPQAVGQEILASGCENSGQPDGIQ
jgi:hypothetical protein